MRKKAILFDLYFTLIFPDIYDEEYASIGLTGQQWIDWCETSRMIHLLSRGEEKTPLEVAARMAQEIPFSVEPAALLKAHHGRISRLLREAKPELIGVLCELKRRGYLLGLVSNADWIDLACWRESELAKLFDASVISCEIGTVKPERGIYEYAMAQLGVTAAECMFVGDGGSQELLGAKALGMETVFTECLLVKDEEKRQTILQSADHRIERFEELLKFT